jgi:phage tail-like protein
LTPNYLWIFDRPEADLGRGRMLVLSRDTYQIIAEFDIAQIIDLDFQTDGQFFFALIKQGDETQICRYNSQHDTSDSVCFTLTKSKRPTAVASGLKGQAFILDSGAGQIVRFDPVKQDEIVLGASSKKVLQDFEPSAMQVDKRGVIFVAGKKDGKSLVQMFSSDGSHLGPLELPSVVTTISGIGFDAGSGVYLATNAGLAKFTLTKNPIGQDGTFYSRVLDNGQVESLWHRISLSGRLPSKSSIQVQYHTSDNESLKSAFERTTNDDALSVEEKVTRIENLFATLWSSTEKFTPTETSNASSSDSAQPDLILNPNKGRYLWFKIRLVTFDTKSRPTVTSARVFYPRLSYLRYLPPLYREDPVSAAFLERFLSMFETGFESLDQQVDNLFHYFDSSLAPKAFLPWLASWINLSLDDDVPEARVRRFIQRAPFIFSRKGTPRAIVEFLEIYTGKSVYLTEFMSEVKPFIVGQGGRALGSGLVLLGSGPRGMRIGDTTIVGHAAIRDRVSDKDEPFLPLVRRFLISVNMDRNEFERRRLTLERIVREQAPAHTSFTIRTTAIHNTVGQATLGVNAQMLGPESYRVGLTQLGSGFAIAKGPPAIRLERGAWVGSAGQLHSVD